MIETAFYQQQINLYNVLRDTAHKKVVALAFSRLAVFVAAFFTWYFLYGSNLVFLFSAVEIVLFLFLVSKSANARYEKKRAEKLILINERELKAQEGDWTSFFDGSNYRDSNHPFALDMDVFGTKSIYQLINRTVSTKGAKLLADRLKNGTQNIEMTNVGIAELSEQIDWCQQVIAEGMIFLEEEKEQGLNSLNALIGKNSIAIKLGRIILPIIGIGSTVLVSFDLISGIMFTGIVIAVLAIIGGQMKHTNKVSNSVLRYERLVQGYLRQVQLLDSLTLESDQMKEWHSTHFGRGGEMLNILKSLEQIQRRMSFRMNVFVGLALNFFLAWDFRLLNEWDNWSKLHAGKLDDLEEQLAELEVWISGAIYFANHSNMTFAQFNEEDRIFIQGMGHPFISEKVQVTNDLDYAKEERFLIITGPNMAGKSTYLRSVGLAFIAANAGFPVMAVKCDLPKVKLYTSMRNADDLSGNSSFFHAELSRLRFIVDAIERGEKVFVILDEILKGTNSRDKELGSAGFLKKLARLNARGIIATHDLSLCELANQNPQFRNRYFDSVIEEEELDFDYLIRDGICKNMNASFLLKKMDLVD